MQVWSIATNTDVTKLLDNGEVPVISPDGTRVAFEDGGAVKIAPIDAGEPAKCLFFDRGRDSDSRWSPDGSALAFVSSRGDHGLIRVDRSDASPIEYLEPTSAWTALRSIPGTCIFHIAALMEWGQVASNCAAAPICGSV